MNDRLIVDYSLCTPDFDFTPVPTEWVDNEDLDTPEGIMRMVFRAWGRISKPSNFVYNPNQLNLPPRVYDRWGRIFEQPIVITTDAVVSSYFDIALQPTISIRASRCERLIGVGLLFVDNVEYFAPSGDLLHPTSAIALLGVR